ncbi:hypothetical protein NA57DRAFT_72460 [Rhizodiscina lignyota]|uniref:Myb-like domain-containing protein n=1 Tax=Rhizodiscina lignyota TaxID=1504668 RepID=A0A9P4IQG9_9PEZI|nr:hypothetical protein NA57DRAFT_72460 [Rhizodiscina lignyota]
MANVNDNGKRRRSPISDYPTPQSMIEQPDSPISGKPSQAFKSPLEGKRSKPVIAEQQQDASSNRKVSKTQPSVPLHMNLRGATSRTPTRPFEQPVISKGHQVKSQQPHFTPEEDATLIDLKENHNLGWAAVAAIFKKKYPERTEKAIAQRYQRSLAPDKRNHTAAKPTPAKPARAKPPPAKPALAKSTPLKSILKKSTPKGPNFTQEEDETIVSLRENQKLSWGNITVAFNTTHPTRTEKAITQRYQQHLAPHNRTDPSMMKSALSGPSFTKEQDDTILFVRDQVGLVGKQLTEEYNYWCPEPQRTQSAIESRYNRVLSPAAVAKASSKTVSFSSGAHFTPEEDSTIVDLKENHDGWTWLEIAVEYAKKHPGRSHRGLAARYQTHLAPEKRLAPGTEAGALLGAPFSQEEDNTIIRLRETRGLQWKEVTEEFCRLHPRRPQRHILGRYRKHLSKANRGAVDESGDIMMLESSTPDSSPPAPNLPRELLDGRIPTFAPVDPVLELDGFLHGSPNEFLPVAPAGLRDSLDEDPSEFVEGFKFQNDEFSRLAPAPVLIPTRSQYSQADFDNAQKILRQSIKGGQLAETRAEYLTKRVSNERYTDETKIGNIVGNVFKEVIDCEQFNHNMDRWDLNKSDEGVKHGRKLRTRKERKSD